MYALLVVNDTDTLSGLTQLADREGLVTVAASTMKEARQRMAERRPDLVVLDPHLPDGDGMDLMRDVYGGGGTTDVLLFSQYAQHRQYSRHQQFPVKPVDCQQLKTILARVARTPELRKEFRTMEEVSTSSERFGRLIGISAPMQALYLQLERVAPTAATVLITGESGTGKELVAQTLHDLSRRSQQPFVAVNCGAISAHLIESELFGHEKGSFTGALREHKGYFERASGGTLFLDEITEMPAELQVKLLRVLEAGTFMRVGSGREIGVDVRIVAATNRTPEDAVAEGKLREDLMYRLQVFPLHLPPLRDRGRDIELLANHYLAELNQIENVEKRFAEDALHQLKKHHWPGNVRELKNAVQRAFILSDETVDVNCLALHAPKPIDLNGSSFQVHVGSTVAEVERRLILATLQQCHSTREQAADILGISLKTLYNRLREYGADNDLSASDSA